MHSKVILALFLTTLMAGADEVLPLLQFNGDTFTNVTVTRITPTDIFFISQSGMGNAKLADLSPALQAHFHYNPSLAAAKAAAPVRSTTTTHPPVQPAVLKQPTPSNVPEGLEIGQRFPDFSETAVLGSNMSVSRERGTVVLIDFWATWCHPCCEEMPNVIATYQNYHDSGFDILGVSLDENQERLEAFTGAQGMPWPEYFDGQGWDNKLAKIYGVQSIPMNYLLDRNGIIIGKELRGEALGEAVRKALGQ